MRPSASAPVCICCGAGRQIECRSLPFCSGCLSGACQMCRDRLQKSESAPLQVCLCCGMDRQFQYRRLPFCSRCVSGVCRRCRSQVRVSISEMDPKAINLMGGPPGPRMPCGWGCGAKLTTSQMRRHFTDCPRRPTILETMKPPPPKPNRGGRPTGPRMPCGWQCRAKLTATTMRKHFSRCPKRPTVSICGVYL